MREQALQHQTSSNVGLLQCTRVTLFPEKIFPRFAPTRAANHFWFASR